MNILQAIENSIIEIRGVPAILDGDVAGFYGVETKRVNEAVRNNPDKFPPGYVVSLDETEWEGLRSKILTLNPHEDAKRLRSKISTLNVTGEEANLKSKFLTSNAAGEGRNLKSKISTSSWGGSRKLPKAFTEQGLYMLATILKSSHATQTTLAIIETFTKMRRLGRSIKELVEVKSDAEKKSLMQKAGEIITDIFADDFGASESEMTIELNFAVLKFKHTIKQNRKTKK